MVAKSAFATVEKENANRTWQDDLKTAYNLIQEENVSEDSNDSGMETN